MLFVVNYFILILFAATGLSLMMILLKCIIFFLPIVILHTYLIIVLLSFYLVSTIHTIKKKVKQKQGHVTSFPFHDVFTLKHSNILRRIVKHYFPDVIVIFLFCVPFRLNRL